MADSKQPMELKDDTERFTAQEKKLLDTSIREMVALRGQREALAKECSALQKQFKEKSALVMQLMLDKDSHTCQCSDGVHEVYVYDRVRPPTLNLDLLQDCVRDFLARVPPASMTREAYSALFAEHVAAYRKNKANGTVVPTTTLRKRSEPQKASVASARPMSASNGAHKTKKPATGRITSTSSGHLPEPSAPDAALRKRKRDASPAAAVMTTNNAEQAEDLEGDDANVSRVVL